MISSSITFSLNCISVALIVQSFCGEQEEQVKQHQQTNKKSTNHLSLGLTLDDLPDDTVGEVIRFVGKEFLGVGIVNQRFNKIFNKVKLPKETCYGGHHTLETLTEEFEGDFDYKVDHWIKLDYGEYPEIVRDIASGIVLYSREDLLDWVISKRSVFLYVAVCFKALKYRRVKFLKRLFEIIDGDSRNDFKKLRGNCMITYAAFFGHIECFKFFHEELGFVWFEYDIWKIVSTNGHTELMTYLVNELGCSFDE